MIAEETETSITLRMAQGIEETIRHDRIQSLKARALSLVPDGFEQTMTHQDPADLLAFLKGE
jgi:putative heme-binding domain-containing protein